MIQTVLYNLDIDYDDERLPSLYRQAHAVWKTMLEQSEQDGEYMRWTGRMTELIASHPHTNLSQYGHIKRGLEATDAARQFQRGAGGHPSVWDLIREPTLEVWEASGAGRHRPGGTKEWVRGELSSVSERLKDQEEIIDACNSNQVVLAKAVERLDDRLNRLELILRSHEDTLQKVQTAKLRP